MKVGSPAQRGGFGGFLAEVIHKPRRYGRPVTAALTAAIVRPQRPHRQSQPHNPGPQVCRLAHRRARLTRPGRYFNNRDIRRSASGLPPV